MSHPYGPSDSDLGWGPEDLYTDEMKCCVCGGGIRDGSTYCKWKNEPAHPHCFLKKRGEVPASTVSDEEKK